MDEPRRIAEAHFLSRRPGLAVRLARSLAAGGAQERSDDQAGRTCRSRRTARTTKTTIYLRASRERRKSQRRNDFCPGLTWRVVQDCCFLLCSTHAAGWAWAPGISRSTLPVSEGGFHVTFVSHRFDSAPSALHGRALCDRAAACRMAFEG